MNHERSTIKRNLIFIIAIVFLLNGCSTRQVLKQNQEISNKSISIKWNTHKWDFNKEEHQAYVLFSQGYGDDYQTMYIKINYQDIHGKIGILVLPYNANYALNGGKHYLPDSNLLFEKNSNYKKLKRKPDGTPLMMTVNAYGTRVYNEKWEDITYIKGLRCIDSVFLRHLPWSEKVYKTYCGYYDKNKNKKILYIEYSHDDIVQHRYWKQYDNIDILPTSQPFEILIKQAVKELVKTIKIKNFDKEKMIEEGLYYPNEEFKSTKW